MAVVVDIWRCLVWSMPMLLAMRALDLVSGPSCHWQWTGSIFFFSGDFFGELLDDVFFPEFPLLIADIIRVRCGQAMQLLE